MNVSIYFNAYDNTGIRFACTSDFFCNQTTTYKSVRNQDARASLMLRRPATEHDPFVRRLRELVDADVSRNDVRFILEMEFGRLISRDELISTMRTHGIQWSGAGCSVARKAA